MTTTDRDRDLLGRDWGSAWDDLPDAPELVARPKTAQITLRLPAALVADAKRIGAARHTPYHVLVRGWMLDDGADASPAAEAGPNAVQLNVKLTREQLDEIKAAAHLLRRPYHRLARDRIQAAVARERSALGAPQARRPSVQELMVLLLHQKGPSGGDAVRGITRLQKLLFVVERELGAGNAFYAHNYGPFSTEVLDAAEALRIAGFIGERRSRAARPSFVEMVSQVERRAGPRTDAVEVFALTPEGHDAAERLRRSAAVYEELFAAVGRIRRRWDLQSLDELVERVYEEYPEYAERSVIRHEVAERARRRGRRQ